MTTGFPSSFAIRTAAWREDNEKYDRKNVRRPPTPLPGPQRPLAHWYRWSHVLDLGRPIGGYGAPRPNGHEPRLDVGIVAPGTE